MDWESDAPLALYKGTQAVVPIQSMTGKFINGSCHPTANCGTYSIYWSEGTGSTYRMHGTQADGPPSWYGSLIESQQDASGLQYKRNRYYDPQSGRFTQEDPIGLAGGLNAYGFAGGDPVNFSDPFGLCPPKTMAEVPMCIGQQLVPLQNFVEDGVGAPITQAGEGLSNLFGGHPIKGAAQIAMAGGAFVGGPEEEGAKLALGEGEKVIFSGNKITSRGRK